MTRVLRFALALGLALFLHFVGARLWGDFPLAFDLFLVVLVRQALDGSTFAGLLAGIVVGAVEDVFSGRVYGFYGCADTAVGYLVALVAQRVVIQRATGVMLAFFAASVGQQAILLLLALLILPGAGAPQVPWILIRAGSAAVLGGAWHVLGSLWRSRYDSWRRNRGSRLQFGR